MTKTFNSERERLEKEIERNKKKAYSYIELEGDVQASIKDMQFHILVKELQAKLTQLNEDEEIVKEMIDSLKDKTINIVLGENVSEGTEDIMIELWKVVIKELKQKLEGGK